MGKEAKAKQARKDEAKATVRFHVTDLERAYLVQHFTGATVQKNASEQATLIRAFAEFRLNEVHDMLQALPERSKLTDFFPREEFVVVEPGKATVAYVLDKTGETMATSIALVLHGLRERISAAQKDDGGYVVPGDEDDDGDEPAPSAEASGPSDGADKTEAPAQA